MSSLGENIKVHFAGNDDDMLWTYDGKLYRLCFRELPLEDKDIILDDVI